jgi:TetR/AcrR family transcriptional regulator of autoinduction and epiphytic fitness
MNDTDGRKLRGARTRERIIRAVVDLAREGELHPPARLVADRAGVSLRNVYHHFSDIVTMRETALRSETDRHFETFPTLDRDTPLEERIATLAAQCSALFETTAPLRKALSADPEAAEQSATSVKEWRRTTRQKLRRAFEAELPSDKRARREVLDALDLATSWGNWLFLRDILGRSPSEAAAVVERSISGIFAASSDAAAA